MLEAHFCTRCGTPLAETCAYCDQVIPQAATFCPACGQPAAHQPLSVPTATPPIVPATLPREQEYKNVTVLACALTEAPARAMELGDEVMYELMQTLFTHAQEVVPQYAGTITQWGSDGFTALFGAPVAYEDHAWRAVLAAYALRERLDQPLTTSWTLSNASPGCRHRAAHRARGGRAAGACPAASVYRDRADNVPGVPAPATGRPRRFASE